MKTMHLCLSLLFVFVFNSPAITQCRAPSFHVGQDFSNPEQRVGSLSVSLQPKDFTIRTLSCLCQTLLKKYPKWETSGVEIFTSKDAADNWSHMLSAEAPPEAKRWEREYHASYSFNKSKHQDELDILPLGLRGPASFNTALDLPITTPVHCRLELGNRCLIVALEEIGYPEEALKARIAGKVTVEGVIDRKGAIGRLRVVSADRGPKSENVLANAALRDLTGWRFDSGNRDEAVQIVYSFEIAAPDPFQGAETSVSFSMPNEVDIRVRPRGTK